MAALRSNWQGGGEERRHAPCMGSCGPGPGRQQRSTACSAVQPGKQGRSPHACRGGAPADGRVGGVGARAPDAAAGGQAAGRAGDSAFCVDVVHHKAARVALAAGEAHDGSCGRARKAGCNGASSGKSAQGTAWPGQGASALRGGRAVSSAAHACTCSPSTSMTVAAAAACQECGISVQASLEVTSLKGRIGEVERL